MEVSMARTYMSTAEVPRLEAREMETASREPEQAGGGDLVQHCEGMIAEYSKGC